MAKVIAAAGRGKDFKTMVTFGFLERLAVHPTRRDDEMQTLQTRINHLHKSSEWRIISSIVMRTEALARSQTNRSI